MVGELEKGSSITAIYHKPLFYTSWQGVLAISKVAVYCSASNHDKPI